MSEIIKSLLEYGPIGVVACFALFLYWRERERNEQIQKERLEDVREHLESMNDLEDALGTLVMEFRSKLDQIIRELDR